MTKHRVRAMPILGALTLLFLAGAGCFQRDRIAPPPAPTAENKENLVGIISLAPVEVHKSQNGANGGSCKVDLVYPSITESTYLDATGAFEKDVYTFLYHQLESEVVYTSQEEVEQAAEIYLADCIARLENEGSDTNLEGYMDQYLSVDFTVELNTLHMLSVNLKAEGYNGGAHGFSTEKFVNADLGGNKLITLGDIIIDEKLMDFFRQEKERLLAEQGEVLYPSSSDEFTTFIDDTSEMSAEEQYSVYGQFENFYLTPTSIVTFYDSYEIAPYAAGPIRVELPLVDIKDYIDPNEPFYPVLEQVLANN